MGNLCSSSRKITKSTKATQTDISPFYSISNRELINNRYNAYKANNPCSKSVYKSKYPSDNGKLNSSVLADWKHPSRNMDNDDLNGCNNAKTKDADKSTGVWPINGSGDCPNTLDIAKPKQRKIPIITRDTSFKLDYPIDLSDVDNDVYDDNLLYDEHNETIPEPKTELVNNNNDTNLSNDILHTEIPSLKSRIAKPIRKPNPPNKSAAKSKENLTKPKPKKIVNNNKMKLNSNSNNHNILQEQQKINGNSTTSNAHKFHPSSLLDQDSYPIQYTFYVDDNESCTKPFYDRRMVAIAKTCRCRIYFHAKSDDNEKPLYYKGKPVRPVTITSPDMACLRRCLGSIDSQFPYFNCKAFLSLSC